MFGWSLLYTHLNVKKKTNDRLCAQLIDHYKKKRGAICSSMKLIVDTVNNP